VNITLLVTTSFFDGRRGPHHVSTVRNSPVSCADQFTEGEAAPQR
jgi:hypothetical protein